MATRFLDRRWPWLVAAAAIVLVFLSTIVEIRLPGDLDPRPEGSVDDILRLRERGDLNLLFVLVDTLRAEHLGSYGYARDTSPELDRLAATGVRFARHLAQSSWTKASMASLWTAHYPVRTGVTRFDDMLPEGARLPAEILKEAGFRTVGLYRNGWVAPTFGFQRGFDVYTKPAPLPVDPSVRIENPTLSARSTDESTVAAALEFLRVYGRERWFLYLHLMDVHEYIYDQESALFGGSYEGAYDNSIRFVDGTLAILFSQLAEQGYADDTLVVVAADHGEAFRERRGIEGHARRVYRESTEVPLLLAFPFRLPQPVVVTSRTRNVDIWPTLLDLLGLEFPPGADGRSRVPEILAAARGEAQPEEEPVAFAHLDRHWGQGGFGPSPTVAVVDGTFRYVRTLEGPRRVEELFDAAGDPRELEDRAQAEPEALERLRGLADAYLETPPAWGDAPTREIGELELNQLRALGYALPGGR